MRLDRQDDVCTFHIDADSHGRSERLDPIPGQIVASDLIIRIDLGNVQMVTSPDLAQLVELHKESNRRGRSMVIRNAQPAVRKVFTVTRLDQVLCVD
jgi:anti-anti-sigma factor